jgi:DNA-directed RNA polymerase specialized sigma24 family protein
VVQEKDMATPLRMVLEHLQQIAPPPDGSLSDGQLLARFIAARDEAAFAALLRRQGGMVLSVARRVVCHAQDAEDVLQGTFLVLALRANSVAKREPVGSWLHGVAYRTALEARAVNARRRARGKQVEDMPHPEVAPAEPQDWRPLEAAKPVNELEALRKESELLQLNLQVVLEKARAQEIESRGHHDLPAQGQPR